MIPIRGEERKIQHWPSGMPMGMFGTNQANEPIYRVIWAESRLHLVGGRWKDRDSAMPNDAEVMLHGKDRSIVREVDEYRWVARYPGLKKWILEKWLPAFEYAGSPERWELDTKDPVTGLLQLGPYPARGEYEMCYAFPSTPAQVETVIGMLEKSKGISFGEKKRAIQENLDKEHAAYLNRVDEVVLGAQPAFGTAAVSGIPGKRRPEDVKLQLTDADLRNMPKGDGKFFQN